MRQEIMRQASLRQNVIGRSISTAAASLHLVLQRSMD
jgi:hypothetical protein